MTDPSRLGVHPDRGCKEAPRTTFRPDRSNNPESFPGYVRNPCDPDFMKVSANHLTPGEKVAYYRRRRGMSQVVLAGLMGKTESWVEKIESGRASLQMLPNIALLARLFSVSPLDLLPDDFVQSERDTRAPSVPALRQQLLSYRVVNPRYMGNSADPLPSSTNSCPPASPAASPKQPVVAPRRT